MITLSVGFIPRLAGLLLGSPAGATNPGRAYEGAASSAPTAGRSIDHPTNTGRPPVAPTVAWEASPYQLLARYRDLPTAMLEFLGEGPGPLGVEPTCILSGRV
jgi:hypothetical protein